MNKILALTLMITAISPVGCKSGGQDNYCGVTDVCGDLVSNDAVDAVVDVDFADILKCRDIPDVDAADAGADIVIVPSRQDCWACDTTADCKAGYECLPVGAGKNCMRRCVDDSDCLSGFICYESGADKFCMPISYSCPACIYDTPCQDGLCCDFNTGACKKCKDDCQSCSYDYDCAAGLRCYKENGVFVGYCTPECTDGICPKPEHQTCTDDGRGVMICVPEEGNCPDCVPPTPFKLPDGSCVECLDSYDCDGDTCCDDATHTCEMTNWATGCKFCEKCVCSWCCSDEDCAGYSSGTGLCLPDGTCEGVLPCGGLCNEDFPICAIVQGAEQCVQCKVDVDCAAVNPGCTCTGDPIYACVDEVGAICQKDEKCTAICQTDADCPPASTGASLSCSVVDGSGICFDPTGSCDGVSLCCAVGQKCFDLRVLLFGVMGGGGMPVEIPPNGLGYCTCDDANPCISGKDCTDMAVLCTDSAFVGGYGDLVCPDGQLSPSFPPRLCVDLADLTGGIF